MTGQAGAKRALAVIVKDAYTFAATLSAPTDDDATPPAAQQHILLDSSILGYIACFSAREHYKLGRSVLALLPSGTHDSGECASCAPSRPVPLF